MKGWGLLCVDGVLYLWLGHRWSAGLDGRPTSIDAAPFSTTLTPASAPP
jgi:hypothetical protein